MRHGGEDRREHEGVEDRGPESCAHRPRDLGERLAVRSERGCRDEAEEIGDAGVDEGEDEHPKPFGHERLRFACSSADEQAHHARGVVGADEERGDYGDERRDGGACGRGGEHGKPVLQHDLGGDIVDLFYAAVPVTENHVFAVRFFIELSHAGHGERGHEHEHSHDRYADIEALHFGEFVAVRKEYPEKAFHTHLT